MKSLSSHLVAYRQTPKFTQDTIPDGLRNQHTTKESSWAKICVLSGQLRYRILTDPPEEKILSVETPGIVEPQVPHQVEPLGEVEFYIEFYRDREKQRHM